MKPPQKIGIFVVAPYMYWSTRHWLELGHQHTLSMFAKTKATPPDDADLKQRGVLALATCRQASMVA